MSETTSKHNKERFVKKKKKIRLKFNQHPY